MGGGQGRKVGSGVEGVDKVAAQKVEGDRHGGWDAEGEESGEKSKVEIFNDTQTCRSDAGWLRPAQHQLSQRLQQGHTPGSRDPEEENARTGALVQLRPVLELEVSVHVDEGDVEEEEVTNEGVAR